MSINKDYHGACKLLTLILLSCLTSPGYTQEDRVKYFPKQVDSPKKLPEKNKVWIFLMAGQSNMAGRGVVEPQDTLSHPRILTINRNNEIISAKEPLHFYEPNLTGLDCGVSFARELIKHQNTITILLVPAAVGGSSTQQWLGDSLHRNVKLLSNFNARVGAVKKYGTIKGILWHQGEADTEGTLIPGYEERLQKIFAQLRLYCDNATLPIMIGELGSFSGNQANWDLINQSIHHYVSTDKQAAVVDTHDLKSKDDKIHFNSEGQRIMGERMAKAFLEMLKN
jgi:hypothetical protein